MPFVSYSEQKLAWPRNFNNQWMVIGCLQTFCFCVNMNENGEGKLTSSWLHITCEEHQPQKIKQHNN